MRRLVRSAADLDETLHVMLPVGPIRDKRFNETDPFARVVNGKQFGIKYAF